MKIKLEFINDNFGIDKLSEEIEIDIPNELYELFEQKAKENKCDVSKIIEKIIKSLYIKELYSEWT